MPTLDIPKDLTPEQQQELKNNFYADQAAKHNDPSVPKNEHKDA